MCDGAYLGSDVVRGATEGGGESSVPHVLLAHPEIRHLHVAL